MERRPRPQGTYKGVDPGDAVLKRQQGLPTRMQKSGLGPYSLSVSPNPD